MHMTIEEVREAILAVPRADWGALAERSEVPLSTIEKVAYGVSKKPGYETITSITAALPPMKRRKAKAVV